MKREFILIPAAYYHLTKKDIAPPERASRRGLVPAALSILPIRAGLPRQNGSFVTAMDLHLLEV